MSLSDKNVLALLTDRSENGWLNRQLGIQLATARKIPGCERHLFHLLSDSVEWVRFHALKGLIEFPIAPAQILPYAERLLSDPFFRVRQLAEPYIKECLSEILSEAENVDPSAPFIPVPHLRKSAKTSS